MEASNLVLVAFGLGTVAAYEFVAAGIAPRIAAVFRHDHRDDAAARRGGRGECTTR